MLHTHIHTLILSILSSLSLPDHLVDVEFVGTDVLGTKYGGYDAQNKKVYIAIRLLADVPTMVFTLAHELAHYAQDYIGTPQVYNQGAYNPDAMLLAKAIVDNSKCAYQKAASKAGVDYQFLYEIEVEANYFGLLFCKQNSTRVLMREIRKAL